MTWIGAAAFAAHIGARLPTRAECDLLTSATPLNKVNAAYRYGDASAASGMLTADRRARR